MSTYAGIMLYLLANAAPEHGYMAQTIYSDQATRYMYDAHGSKFATVPIIAISANSSSEGQRYCFALRR